MLYPRITFSGTVHDLLLFGTVDLLEYGGNLQLLVMCKGHVINSPDTCWICYHYGFNIYARDMF